LYQSKNNLTVLCRNITTINYNEEERERERERKGDKKGKGKGWSRVGKREEGEKMKRGKYSIYF